MHSSVAKNATARYLPILTAGAQASGSITTISVFVNTAEEALGLRTNYAVTPAVYPRLVEFLHFDIQSTGQKSHCVNTVSGHRNALF